MTAGAHLPLRQRAEHLASTLPPLLVAAEQVAATVAQGVHGRRRVGVGETFWQFREYAPGDRPQSIDWRQSAKSDRVFVRESEWEAAQSLWIWRDASPSMTWRSTRDLPTKRARADLITLALSALAMRGGEHVTLLGAGHRPASGRAALNRLCEQIERGEGPPGDAPPVVPVPRHSHVVIIGDLLAPLDAIDRVVRRYAERGCRGFLLQILDPAEETLPYGGRVRFEGLEGEEPWLLARADAVRADYAERLARQRAGLRAITRAATWGFSSHRTDAPPQAALLTLYGGLAEARNF